MRMQASYRHKVKDRIPKPKLKQKPIKYRQVQTPVPRFTVHPIFGIMWMISGV